MIERKSDRLRVTVPMIMSNADGLLEAGRSAFRGPRDIIDLSAVEAADSSALAVLVAWLRQARSENRSLLIINAPANIKALSDLYGVDDVLALA